MKKVSLLATLLTFAFLFSCNNKPGNAPATPDQIENETETTAVVRPVEWNFDLLWKVLMSVPQNDRPAFLRNDDAAVREQMRAEYAEQSNKNGLYKYHYDDVRGAQVTSMYCFPYADANKFYVLFFLSEEDQPGRYTTNKSFDYDLDKGTMTEVANPLKSLELADFFDPLTLADISESKMAELKSYGELFYMFGFEDFDMLVLYTWPAEEVVAERENRLAYVWDGHSFVRKPECDLLGYTIYEDGFCSLDFGTPIPKKLEGYDIVYDPFMAEGMQQDLYSIQRGGIIIMELLPKFDMDKDAFVDAIDEIRIYSPRYQTYGEFHVGSNISDVLDTYGEENKMFLTFDDQLVLDLGGLQFIADPEDYDGKLPEVTSFEGAVIENPTFKPDAKVTMIRLYSLE